MPNDAFRQGSSRLPATLTASEYWGLLWQLRVILGENDTDTEGILPDLKRVTVTEALVALLNLRDALWKPVHIVGELDALQLQIQKKGPSSILPRREM